MERIEGYIIIEVQTQLDGTSAYLVETEPIRNNADSTFYLKMSSAAISTVPIHTVKLFDIYGNELMTGTYDHREVD